MSDRIGEIRKIHGTMDFGSRENFLRQLGRAADLYRCLTDDEARELARHAIDTFDPDKSFGSHQILICLACLRPGSLAEFHPALVGHGIFDPAVIFHGASPEVAARIVNLLPGGSPHHMLGALAWIGDGVALDAFRSWRDDPPDWAAGLRLPTRRYTEAAGWELTPGGARRDLFVRECRPLVEAGDGRAVPGIAGVVGDHAGARPWCGRRMITLLELDLTSSEVGFLGLPGRRLRIVTCEVCTLYVTVFTRIDRDGGSTWHEANRKPDYFPVGYDHGELLPRGCLEFSDTPRGWLDATSWLVPGIPYPQVGGHPTWFEDAEYPHCPDCGRAMPFIAQLSTEGCEEFGEGIYHMFACRECGVAATGYQQS